MYTFNVAFIYSEVKVVTWNWSGWNVWFRGRRYRGNRLNYFTKNWPVFEGVVILQCWLITQHLLIFPLQVRTHKINPSFTQRRTSETVFHQFTMIFNKEIMTGRTELSSPFSICVVATFCLWTERDKAN